MDNSTYVNDWGKQQPGVILVGLMFLSTLIPAAATVAALYLLALPLIFAVALPALMVVDFLAHTITEKKYSYPRHFWQHFNPLRFSKTHIWSAKNGRYVPENALRTQIAEDTTRELEKAISAEAENLPTGLRQLDPIVAKLQSPMMMTIAGFKKTAQKHLTPREMQEQHEAVPEPNLNVITRHFLRGERTAPELTRRDFAKSPIFLEDELALAHSLKVQNTSAQKMQTALDYYLEQLGAHERSAEHYAKYLSESLFHARLQEKTLKTLLADEKEQLTHFVTSLRDHPQVQAAGYKNQDLEIWIEVAHPKVENKVMGPYKITYGEDLFVADEQGYRVDLGPVLSQLRRGLSQYNVAASLGPVIGFLKHNSDQMNVWPVDSEFEYPELATSPNWSTYPSTRKLKKDLAKAEQGIEKLEQSLKQTEDVLMHARREMQKTRDGMHNANSNEAYKERAQELEAQRQQILAQRPVRSARFATWNNLVHLVLDLHPYIYEGWDDINYIATELKVAIPIDNQGAKDFWLLCAKDPNAWPMIHMNMADGSSCWGSIEEPALKAIAEGDILTYTLLCMTLVGDPDLDANHKDHIGRFMPTPKKPGWYLNSSKVVADKETKSTSKTSQLMTRGI